MIEGARGPKCPSPRGHGAMCQSVKGELSNRARRPSVVRTLAPWALAPWQLGTFNVRAAVRQQARCVRRAVPGPPLLPAQ